MKKIIGRKIKKQQVDLDDLEIYLENMLQPVIPRVSFVSELKKSLIQSDLDTRLTPNLFQYALLTIVGLVTSIFIVVIGIRTTRSIIIGSGGLQSWRFRTRPKQAAPLHSMAG
jgi:hypothetical protein